MHRPGENRQRALLVGAFVLMVAACGGSDGDALVSPTDVSIEASTTTLPASTDVPPVSEGTIDVTSTVATTTVADTTIAATTTVTTTGAVIKDSVLDSTTVPTTLPPDDNDDIDEARLALAAAGLYTLPGTGAPCSLQDSPAHFEYLFPAVGGDLYMLCLRGDYEAGAPIDPFELKLTRPDGSTAIDATVDDFGDGRSLVIRRSNKTPVALGEYGTQNQTQAMVPIYLPHDRRAGSWRVESAVGSATLDIDRPCAGQSGPSQTDPLNIPPSLQFARNPFVDFDHCRKFPDVTNVDLATAGDRIGAWAHRLGITADISTDVQCADDAMVVSSSPGVDEVFRWTAGLPVHPVALTLEPGCGVTETTTTTTLAVDDDEQADESGGPDVDDVDDGPTDTDPAG